MYLPMLGFAAAAGWLLTRVADRGAGGQLVVVALTRRQHGANLRVDDRGTAVARGRPARARKSAAEDPIGPRGARRGSSGTARRRAQTGAVRSGGGRRNREVLLSEGQPAAALEEFGRALALDPRDARNFNNRGVALDALGQTEAARQDFERALGIDPGLTEARQNLEKLPPPGR